MFDNLSLLSKSDESLARAETGEKTCPTLQICPAFLSTPLLRFRFITVQKKVPKFIFFLKREKLILF